MEDIVHLVDDGGVFVGDDDFARVGGDHLVHALGAQVGGVADVFLAHMVDVVRSDMLKWWGARLMWWWDCVIRVF